MFGWFCRFLFKIWGWKIQGEIPHHLAKKLYVVIPHTSNWDFPLGILLKFGFKMEVGFIAKSSLFKWPYAWFFRALGGIPVDRKKAHGFIDSVVNVIKSRERFTTSIAPEGTRSKVKKLKTGFYHIARLAEIPLVYVKFDWGNKVVDFAPPREVYATLEEELDFISKHFKNTVGKVPANTFGYPFNKESV
ncbi:MAG: 1-acyl-sn-glycerol-3-phosphate acyltransferase [Saprospiraceae bacterium]|nr:1-acyl-sn-glycerol-3-phosphate acyltransferase [Saprospiraceae bacterium]